jgi:enoyl-CoA hydratase
VVNGFANRAFPAETLESDVLRIAQRVAKVPPDLQALNKRNVHRGMEAMGMRNGMRAAADINALGFHQQSSREYFARFASGVTTALSERDSQFGDYRTTGADR